jgi:SpoVK/Ycf46/Vps4 family AAA+-type ATPase
LGWDDLVLPEALKAELHAIPVQVEQGAKVWEEWGFSRRVPYGQGVAALFAGPSGTGKTMAAQIIAAEMAVPLFHVDLAQTVSKYIGETEKALGRIFDAAEGAGAVLLFDEADALFGKRSEVRDAHDRYANIEVAYLLQRMEEYRGLAILTTNAKQNVDTAFLRRLRFVVDFPTPDAGDREKIWKSMFPSDAPLGEDVDLAFLAQRLALTGGNIQQIALRAAFDAAAENSKTINMGHVVAATRRELNKLGMQGTERLMVQVAPSAGAQA